MSTRLQSELRRLYGPRSSMASPPTAELGNLIDEQGQVRAMALSLGRPADWEAVSALWLAVQSELSLPAPGIAVSGVDSYQLWFSLDEAVPLAEAHAFVAALQARYLGAVMSERVGLLPGLAAAGALAPAPGQAPAWPADTMPPRRISEDQWSAFVAPDLAPIFADTPWLDIAPSLDGQAELLSRLHRIKPLVWRAAKAQLEPAAAPASSPSTSAPSPACEHAGPRGPYQDPKRFLLDVMNDPAVAMALRIEAAKALLPHAARDDDPAPGSYKGPMA